MVSTKHTTETSNDDMIRIEEAAQLTGMTVGSIRVKCCKGQLPHYKQFGKLFFSKNELTAMIAAGRRHTPNELQQLIDRAVAR